ncbi:hypothetical protein KP509_01G032300 [Ceratopteris richardii]|nr:hypothetical protein KP509_01G032300 [Ceratopteris richardii]
MAVDNTSFQKKTLDRINPLFTTTTQSCTPFASPISAVTTELQSSPLEKLRNGYLKFKENYMKDQTLVKTLAEGQQPPYMIIACCDSRVDPCTVLNLGPGEAFVLRNIGNMVPPYSSEKACSSAASAMEFAVLFLKVKHLVVIGHSQCGAVRALMGMEDDGSNAFSEFIEDWVLISKGASKKVKDMHRSSPFEEQCTSCEKEVINTSLLNCLSYPFVRQRMASGELTLHGGYYDFINNQFESWDVDLSCTSSLDKFQ